MFRSATFGAPPRYLGGELLTFELVVSSFLPQDKVSEFAHMSPQQLLRETQRAAGDPRLTNWHDTLIAAGKEMAQLAEVRVRLVVWAYLCSLHTQGPQLGKATAQDTRGSQRDARTRCPALQRAQGVRASGRLSTITLFPTLHGHFRLRSWSLFYHSWNTWKRSASTPTPNPNNAPSISKSRSSNRRISQCMTSRNSLKRGSNA